MALPPLIEVRQPAKLGLIGGDYDLAAPLVLDTVLLAELDERADATHAELGFLRPRTVVNARVDHSAVVGGLMYGQLLLLFDYRDPAPWVPLGKL